MRVFDTAETAAEADLANSSICSIDCLTGISLPSPSERGLGGEAVYSSICSIDCLTIISLPSPSERGLGVRLCMGVRLEEQHHAACLVLLSKVVFHLLDRLFEEERDEKLVRILSSDLL